MIANVVDTPRQSALKRVFAAYRAETSAETVKAYREGLADVPDTVLVPAIDEAIKGEAFFPSVARIRTYCDRFKPEIPDRPMLPPAVVTVEDYRGAEVSKFLPDDDPRLWHHCTACNDTGMVEEFREVRPNYTMPVAIGAGNTARIERREIKPYMQSYFSHCHCRATNPVLIRERQRNAKYSREREKP